MNKAIHTVLLVLSFAVPTWAQVHVDGYYRKNGTYVQPHYRSSPDGNPYNNYSYPGNTNPYTGKTATGNEDTYLKNYYGNQSSSSNNYGYPNTRSNADITINQNPYSNTYINSTQTSEYTRIKFISNTYSADSALSLFFDDLSEHFNEKDASKSIYNYTVDIAIAHFLQIELRNEISKFNSKSRLATYKYDERGGFFRGHVLTSGQNYLDTMQVLLHFYRAGSKYDLKDFQSAISDYEYCLSSQFSSPVYKDCLYNMGLCVYITGNPSKGCDLLQRAVHAGHSSAQAVLSKYCR